MDILEDCLLESEGKLTEASAALAAGDYRECHWLASSALAGFQGTLQELSMIDRSLMGIQKASSLILMARNSWRQSADPASLAEFDQESIDMRKSVQDLDNKLRKAARSACRGMEFSGALKPTPRS